MNAASKQAQKQRVSAKTKELLAHVAHATALKNANAAGPEGPLGAGPKSIVAALGARDRANRLFSVKRFETKSQAQRQGIKIGGKLDRHGTTTVHGARPSGAGVPANVTSSVLKNPAGWTKTMRSAAHLAPMDVDAPPAAYGGLIHSGMPKVEPSRRNGPGNTVIMTGSEFLGRVFIPNINPSQTFPAGGVLFYMPVNFLGWDSSRLANAARMYEQFRVKALIFEYEPACPTSTPGALVGYCGSNASEAHLVTGDGALRAAFSRPGFTQVPVWERASFGFVPSQQKWYFTVLNDEDPLLSLDGYFALEAALDFTPSTTVVAPLGTIWCHYEVEFRVPALEAPSDFAFNAIGCSANFNVAQTVGNAVALPAANMTGLPAAYQDTGVIGMAIVMSADDTGPVTTTWRNWLAPNNGNSILIGPGVLIFFRFNANLNFYFYPDLSSAMAGNAGPYGDNTFLWTINGTPAATVGFKFAPIRAISMQDA